MTPDVNGDIVIDPKNPDIPLDGLADVTSIVITTDNSAALSDISLHACNVPGTLHVLRFLIQYSGIFSQCSIIGKYAITSFI